MLLKAHMAELTTNQVASGGSTPLRLLIQRGVGAPLLLLAVLAMVVLPLRSEEHTSELQSLV